MKTQTFPSNAVTRSLAVLAASLLLGLAACQKAAEPVAAPTAPVASTDATTLTADEARAIAKDAYIYGFPMVDSYRIQHSYFVDTKNPEYKGGWNQVHNTARVFTPADKAVQTPNSDTPYSMLGYDLRAEPLVLSVPAVESGRYYSLQFIDLYTFNFAYVGSRATGNEAGNFLLAGPGWQGQVPAGIKDVIRSESNLGLVLYRTQLFNPGDIDKVKVIQAGYKVQPLSAFLNMPAPTAAPAIAFIAPLPPEQEKTSPGFFGVMNFLFQFAPTDPSETELMARFAKLGIGPGKTFDASALSPDIRKAVDDGMADAWKAFAEHKATKIDTGLEASGDGFGTRAYLANNYMRRMTSAVLGIYGNSKEEAIYPLYFVDATGQKLDGSQHGYTLHFAADQLPPVNAFWSLTLYELPSSLLSANPLDRYLINSPMLPDLKRDADGGLTLYVQNMSPGKAKEANWLPAPKGPFFSVLRLYWPKPEALDGRWKAPPMEQAK